MYMSIKSPAAGIFNPILFCLFVLFIWKTEFRTRAHRVLLADQKLFMNTFFGFGLTKSYNYAFFDGFITSQQP